MSVQVIDTIPFNAHIEKENVAVTLASLSSSGASTPTQSRFLIQSPYVDAEHLLDLDTLDRENSLFARALTEMRHTREDYATAPYEESFNWDEIFAELRRLVAEEGRGFKQTSFYVVAFRSQIKAETDTSHLGALDRAAHAEAVASGGFLKYWFGSPNADRRNLATCLWRSREDAIAGGRGPAHRRAAGSTRSLYSHWKIDQHRLTIGENAENWEISDWE